MIEEWKQIDGWPYRVSNTGNVVRIYKGRKGNEYTKPLKPFADRAGYHRVILQAPGRKHVCRAVHRLVAAAFIGKCPKGKNVNHIDFDPGHNDVENLEYTTPKENSQHSAKAGRLRNQYTS